ncbi:MAG: patatin-like phospholipase family protein [Clostridia bacterium]|nr:patatin-like phospholipase family protein [Clostridia bacterium]
MSKGAYEIGCLKAISEYFTRDEIQCISASSIGVLNAYAFSKENLDELALAWKEIDIREAGSFFPSFSGNATLIGKIRRMCAKNGVPEMSFYATVWNYTERKIEYVPFHKLSEQELADYMCASVAIPIFNKGVRLKGCTMFDGAFLDNTPVYPLLEKNLDYIFCVYFDGQSYFFENEAFDRKIIKLYKFPIQKRLENMTFDPKRIDGMVTYGYEYTKNTINQLFAVRDKEQIDARLRAFEEKNKANATRRLTGDVLMTNLNKLTKRFAKRTIL